MGSINRFLKRNKQNKTADQPELKGPLPKVIEVSKMTRDRKARLEADLKRLQIDLEMTSVALNEQIVSICSQHDIDFNTKNIKWDPTGSALIITDRPEEPAAQDGASEEANINSPENTSEHVKEDEGAGASEQEGGHQDQSGDPEAKV